MSTSLYHTILLIDDDSEDQEIFEDALKEVYPDIVCVCCGDGEEAVLKLVELKIPKPDLLFIDLNMPKLNGKEVLKTLKNIESLKNIPIIMFSTFFADLDKKELHEFGAVHSITKSPSFKELCNTLKETLSKKW